MMLMNRPLITPLLMYVRSSLSFASSPSEMCTFDIHSHTFHGFALHSHSLFYFLPPLLFFVDPFRLSFSYRFL